MVYPYIIQATIFFRVRTSTVHPAACNVLVVAKLCYVLQVLHCASPNIQRLHRCFFAMPVWGATWRPMRRDNLFRPVKAGGLGLAHLSLITPLYMAYKFPHSISTLTYRSVSVKRFFSAWVSIILPAFRARLHGNCQQWLLILFFPGTENQATHVHHRGGRGFRGGCHQACAGAGFPRPMTVSPRLRLIERLGQLTNV